MAKRQTASVSPQHRDGVRARLRGADRLRAGPGSVAWKINREVIVVAGWGRAILLQLAHPAIAAGVHQHSSFRGSLLSGFHRLHSTVSAMLSIVFGDTDEVIEAAARINTIHDRVHGQIAAPEGTSAGTAGHIRSEHETSRCSSQRPACHHYSAHDPDLQRWVHATLLDSIPRVYARLVGPLTIDERDRYCEDTAIMETLLAMPAGSLPRTAAQLDAYIGQMLACGTLVVTDSSRLLARALLYPPGWRVVWPLLRPVQLLTIGTLPASLREAYGFEWRPRDARALARWTAFLRVALRLLPPALRQWPIARRRARTERAGEAARERACRGVRGATPL